MCAKIALGQLNAADNPEENLQTITAFADSAAKQGADMLVLPEYAMAYPKAHRPFPSGQAVNGAFGTALCALAKQYQMYLVCGMLEQTGGDKLYNTILVIDRQGKIVRKHHKNHLYCTEKFQENHNFLQGDALFQPLDTDFGRVGLLVCYELRFPELARLQAINGTQILLVSSAFVVGPHKKEQWHALLEARAIENACYICASDHVKPHVFMGESCAYDPNGGQIGALNEQVDLLVVDCDLSRLDEIRKTNTALFQRRPELYAFQQELGIAPRLGSGD